MRRAMVGVVAAGIVSVTAGCSSGGGNGSGTKVSAECDSTLKAIAALAVNADTHTQDVASVNACKSRAEWLAGAEHYRAPGLEGQDHGVLFSTEKGADVLEAICQEDGAATAPGCAK